MAGYEIKPTLNLETFIEEAREFLRAFDELVEALERIDEKYNGKIDKGDQE